MDLTTVREPALILAIAMVVGVVATALAQHLRVPGIVVLLAAGVALGPDGVGIVRPEALGSALHSLVGFSVAVILFEGGLNLEAARLRRQAVVIRRLVTLGALITGVGSAVAAHLLMHWDFTRAALFGSLVIVTGPTVITPILRRVKVNPNVETVLEAEAIFIDAIGAIIAVAVIEVVLGQSLSTGFAGFASRLGLGILVGCAGGILLMLLLKPQRLIPAGLENILALSVAVFTYQLSSHLSSESGIAAVIVAGVVVGNVKTRVHADLLEFKEQLTVLLIALLFVLLAADVRLEQVRSLGLPALLTVLAVMFVVRPLDVFASTWGVPMSTREKLFLSWLAPRGIVAAAVASLFAETLDSAGLSGGSEIRALVFLVIAVTVGVEGLLAGPMARALGVLRPSQQGYVLLGANALARVLGRALRDSGEEVVFVDSNPDTCLAAEREGFKVVYGNGLEERTLKRAGIGIRKGAVGMTPNEQTNFLFGRAVSDFEPRGPRVYVALEENRVGVSESMVRELGHHVLFGRPYDLDTWGHRVRRGSARTETWRLANVAEQGFVQLSEVPAGALLPLFVCHKGTVRLVDEELKLRWGDEVTFLVEGGLETEAVEWFAQKGWEPVRTPGNDTHRLEKGETRGEA